MAQLCEVEVSRRAISARHTLTAQLNALIDAKTRLDLLIKNSATDLLSPEGHAQYTRLSDYRHEILRVRLLRDTEEKTDVLLFNNIISTWRRVRVIRDQQAFVCTRHALVLFKDELNPGLVDATLEEDVKAELRERKELFKADQVLGYIPLI